MPPEVLEEFFIRLCFGIVDPVDIGRVNTDLYVRGTVRARAIPAARFWISGLLVTQGGSAGSQLAFQDRLASGRRCTRQAPNRSALPRGQGPPNIDR